MWERRPKPDVNRSVTEAKAAALETASHERTVSAERFASAYEKLDELVASLSHLPFRQEPEDVPIGRLVESEAALHGAATLIHALGTTDFRIGITTELLVKPPMPSLWSHVTSWWETLDAAASEPQLLGVGAREFVLFLACAIRLNTMGIVHPALRMVHELRVHAARGALDEWAALPGPVQQLLPSAAMARFVLATLGVKAARKLYRRRPAERLEWPGELPQQLSTRGLLEAVEVFAGEQRECAPDSPVGLWNAAWVAKEAVPVRKVLGLAAAADMHELLVRCYTLADETGDDFLRAEARIEAAMALVEGAGGLVGYRVDGGPGQVRRDMRSSQPAAGPTQQLQVMGASAAIRQGVGRNEARRLAGGVHPAFLEAGEMLLVEWWEVRRLWNDAMVPYDALARWKHEHNVYGESTGWDIVDSFLHMTLVEQRLAPGQYAVSPSNKAGFQPRRDHGHGNERECANCGLDANEVTLQCCARCKLVWYCSADCQREDWKHGGHKTVCKKVSRTTR